VPYGQRQQQERLLARHSCSRSVLALPSRLATLAPNRPAARVLTAEAQSVKSLSPLSLSARRQMMSGHHSWPPSPPCSADYCLLPLFRVDTLMSTTSTSTSRNHATPRARCLPRPGLLKESCCLNLRSTTIG
jgi:hypothetical protein